MMSDRSTRNGSGDKKSRMTWSTEIKLSVKKHVFKIKETLGMLARLPWGGEMGSIYRKTENYRLFYEMSRTGP